MLRWTARLSEGVITAIMVVIALLLFVVFGTAAVLCVEAWFDPAALVVGH
jgi:hypothetical protein